MAKDTGFLKKTSQETALQYLVTKVPTAAREDRLSDVLKEISAASYESIESVYVLDGTGRLMGSVRLADLLRMPGETLIGDLMQPISVEILPDADQEEAAGLAIRHDLAAVPVVNQQRRFLGIVPPRSLIKILRLEHIEDLHRFTGIMDGNEQARNALEAPPTRRIRDRLPWLLVGLFGSMAATFLMSRFERTLQERVAIAFFVPGIVYLADAIGTQTEAIAVRGLSFSGNSFRELFFGELVTGLLIGSILGGLSFPVVTLFFGDIRLAAAVALSICMAGGFATSIGLVLPWLLSRAGVDPAFGSGPVATIIQDVLSLIVYFLAVLVFLP